MVDNVRPDQIHQSVICGQCPEVYADTEIIASHGDSKTTLFALRNTGAAVEPAAKKPSAVGKWFGAGVARPTAPKTKLRNLDLTRFKEWTFTCPKNHLVDGNPDGQFPVAILGLSGASKSHFIVGVVQELGRLRRLRGLRISLGDPRYRQVELRTDVDQVYVENRQLEQTDPGTLRGPFAQRLRIGDPDSPDFHSLIMFDIAGESLSSTTSIGEKAPFVLLSEGIVILVDPKECLATQFEASRVRSARQRHTAAVNIRENVTVIAQTLAEVMGVNNSRKLTIPICFTVSKADAVDWADGFDWEGQTQEVITSGIQGHVREALKSASTRARKALIENGGDLIVDEIEELFNTDYIRYSAASATCCMPDEDGGWDGEPDALGIGLTMLHLFDLGGLLDRAHPVPTADAVESELEPTLGRPANG